MLDTVTFLDHVQHETRFNASRLTYRQQQHKVKYAQRDKCASCKASGSLQHLSALTRIYVNQEKL